MQIARIAAGTPVQQVHVEVIVPDGVEYYVSWLERRREPREDGGRKPSLRIQVHIAPFSCVWDRIAAKVHGVQFVGALQNPR